MYTYQLSFSNFPIESSNSLFKPEPKKFSSQIEFISYYTYQKIPISFKQKLSCDQENI